MKVLIGTDGSDDAVEAASRALSLLGPTAAVTVLYVTQAPAIEAAGMESGMAGGVASPDEIDAAWAAVNDDAATAIARTVAALPTVASVEQVVEEGSAGPTICRVAAEHGVDVVAVGSRGRGAIRRALLGSVSSHVANNAPCPVLDVRAQDGE